MANQDSTTGPAIIHQYQQNLPRHFTGFGMRQATRERLCAEDFGGHDWEQINPYEERCMRCGRIK
jgi:hypothetical protein